MQISRDNQQKKKHNKNKKQRFDVFVCLASPVLYCVCVIYVLLNMCRYLQADPEHFDLRDLKCEFDVILLEPPLEEYYRESGISHTERFWTWDDVCMRIHLPHNYACTASDVFRLICLTHFATTDHEIGNRGDLSAPLLCLSVVRLRRRTGPGQNGKRDLSFLSKHILFQAPWKQNVCRTLSSGNKLTLVLF